MRLRRTWLAVGAGVLTIGAGVVAFGGCWSDDPDELTLDDAVQAADITADAETARISMDMFYIGEVSSAADLNATASFTSAGVVALDGSEGELEIEFPGTGQIVEQRIFGGVVYTRDKPEEPAEQTVPSETTTTVAAAPESGDAPPASEPAADAPWLRLDLAALLTAAGVDAETVLQLHQQSDPVQELPYLVAAGGEIEAVDHESVRGVSTSQYRVTIDTSSRPRDTRALRALGVDPAGFRARLETLREDYGVKRLPMDVWLDDDGRVRRQRVRLPVGRMLRAQNVDAAKNLEAVLTVEYYDFGVKVDVEEPAAEQTEDLLATLEAAATGTDAGTGTE